MGKSKALSSALLMLAAVCLSGCGTARAPASGTTSTGEVFKGEATASMSEGGKFSVTGDRGTTCSGTYDAFSLAKRLDVSMTCSNGVTGTAAIVRSNDLKSGRGAATFSDGTTGEFSFGTPT